MSELEDPFERAFDDGYRAGEHGGAESLNPYSPLYKRELFNCWNRGWTKGLQSRFDGRPRQGNNHV